MVRARFGENIGYPITTTEKQPGDALNEPILYITLINSGQVPLEVTLAYIAISDGPCLNHRPVLENPRDCQPIDNHVIRVFDSPIEPRVKVFDHTPGIPQRLSDTPVIDPGGGIFMGGIHSRYIALLRDLVSGDSIQVQVVVHTDKIKPHDVFRSEPVYIKKP